MGGAVFTHQPGAVNTEGDVQVLQGDIVHQLVVTALQEGGVDGDHRLQAFAGHARRQRHGVLLGNGDVVIAVGELAGKTHHARTFAHGRGNADQVMVGGGHVTQPVAKDIGILGFFQGRRLAALAGRGNLGDGVVADGVGLGGREALALGGVDMQQLRSGRVFQVADHLHQFFQIVAVNGADIVETNGFKQRAGGSNHVLDAFFGAAGEIPGRWAWKSTFLPPSRSAM